MLQIQRRGRGRWVGLGAALAALLLMPELAGAQALGAPTTPTTRDNGSVTRAPGPGVDPGTGTTTGKRTGSGGKRVRRMTVVQDGTGGLRTGGAVGGSPSGATGIYPNTTGTQQNLGAGNVNPPGSPPFPGPGPAGTIPGTTGNVPGTTGTVPNTTGTMPNNTGTAPWTTGTVPGPGSTNGGTAPGSTVPPVGTTPGAGAGSSGATGVPGGAGPR